MVSALSSVKQKRNFFMINLKGLSNNAKLKMKNLVRDTSNTTAIVKLTIILKYMNQSLTLTTLIVKSVMRTTNNLLNI